MASIIWLVGLLMAGLGGWVVFQPERLTSIFRWLQTDLGFYLTSITRFTVGIIMLVWAHSCHRPTVIIIIGILALVITFATLAAKDRTFKAFQWITRQPQWICRVWGAIPVTLGILIIWAGWPK
jgi:hypothetical protein